MTDFLLPEKINNIIKSIPKPRLFYKKGIYVGGLFRPYMSFQEYTTAAMFSGSEVITPLTIRFSAMLGDESTPDTVRNIKKMEVRFFTLKGCYDMICQNIPVQFIKDEKKSIELFESFKNKRAFDGINKKSFWQFIVNNPESINAALHLYSNEGLTDSFINIKWYSVNLIHWINEAGEKYLIRIKWVPIVSEPFEKEFLTIKSAEFISGFAPDIAHNELINNIENDSFPKLELQVQIIDENNAANEELYDPTLLWNERQFPFIPVGVLMINKILSDTKRNEICFLMANTIEGVEHYNTGMNDVFDYIYKLEAMERGISL